MTGAWLSVTKFWSYQLYTDRNPPWVKWHVSALDDQSLLNMRTNSRLLFTQLLLVSAKKANVIPNETAWIASEVTLSKRAVSLGVKELVQAGLLVDFDNKSDCVAANELARPTRSEVIAPRTRVTGQIRHIEQKNLSQDRSSRSEITSATRPDLTESEDPHKDEGEQPFARESEPELNGAGYDLPTIEQLPNLEPDDSMERLGVPTDVEELVERWSGESA